MADDFSSLPYQPQRPTPSGPSVPQGIQRLIEETQQAVYDADVILEGLQGSSGLTAPQVQSVKDARNATRGSTLAQRGIIDRGGNGNPIP